VQSLFIDRDMNECLVALIFDTKHQKPVKTQSLTFQEQR